MELASILKPKQILEEDLYNESFCDYWKIICITKGNLKVTAENRVYKLGENDVAIIPSQKFHFIETLLHCEFLYIPFYVENYTAENSVELQNITEEQRSLLEKISDLRSNTNDIDSAICNSLLELFLLLSLKNKNTISPVDDKNSVLFGKAADILMDYAHSQISVTDLAEKLKISVSNLKRIFAACTGTGIHEYFNFFKISAAKELLSRGESVTATAEITGFATQAYFSAAFKRVTGISPKEYSASFKTVPQKTAKQKKQSKSDLPSYLL